MNVQKKSTYIVFLTSTMYVELYVTCTCMTIMLFFAFKNVPLFSQRSGISSCYPFYIVQEQSETRGEHSPFFIQCSHNQKFALKIVRQIMNKY